MSSSSNREICKIKVNEGGGESKNCVCVCKDKLSNETVDVICLKNLISVVIKWKEQSEQSEQCEKKKKKLIHRLNGFNRTEILYIFYYLFCCYQLTK